MRLPITLSILLVLASVAHAENYTTTRPAPRQPRPEPQSAIKPVTNAWQQMVKDGGLVSRYSQQTPKQINEQTIQNPYQRAFYTGGSNNLGQPGYIGPTNNPPTASAPSTASAPPAYSYPPATGYIPQNQPPSGLGSVSVSVRHNERAGARGDGREAPKPAARLPREQDGALDRDELAQIQYIGLSRQALGAACADPAASVTWNGLPVLNLPLQFPETQIVSVPGFQYTSDPSLRTVNIQAPYPLGQPAQTPYYLGRLGGAQPNQPFGGLQAIGANGQ